MGILYVLLGGPRDGDLFESEPSEVIHEFDAGVLGGYFADDPLELVDTPAGRAVALRFGPRGE